jgi:hypothetical protein
MKIRITAGNDVSRQSAGANRPASTGEDDALQRALSDPGVQRFREAFPNAEVRNVRDLKE